MRRAILTGQAKYLVFTEDRGQDQLWLDPPFRDWVLARCTLVRSFGDYRIYRPAEALQKGEADGAARYKEAVNCKACHSAHKPD